VDFLNCVKDAEKWDALEFSDPHFTSAYYRAWKKEGTLASAYGCARPFIFQDRDTIGNAYNFGGTVIFAQPSFGKSIDFANDFEDWRTANNYNERCTLAPWSTDGYPIAVDFTSMYISAKPNVFIDLREDYKFSKGHKHAIKKAEKNRVKCTVPKPTPANAGKFEDMYYTAMRRKGAAEHWIYYPGFFYEVLRELGPRRAVLFFTYVGQDLECACIVLYGGGTAYYHWAARRGEAPDVGAGHFQIFTVANWLRYQGYRRLHLGGGLTAEDSLFTFKKGFSDKTVPVFSYNRS